MHCRRKQRTHLHSRHFRNPFSLNVFRIKSRKRRFKPRTVPLCFRKFRRTCDKFPGIAEKWPSKHHATIPRPALVTFWSRAFPCHCHVHLNVSRAGYIWWKSIPIGIHLGIKRRAGVDPGFYISDLRGGGVGACLPTKIWDLLLSECNFPAFREHFKPFRYTSGHLQSLQKGIILYKKSFMSLPFTAQIYYGI